MAWNKKRKMGKFFFFFYVFICYVNSSRMRNTVRLEKPGIIRVRSTGSGLGSQRAE